VGRVLTSIAVCLLLLYSDPLTVNDLSLQGTNTSCLGDFGGPVMPWVALGGYTGLCPSLPYFAHVTAGYTIFCMKMDHPVGYGRVRGVRVFLLKTQTCVGLHCLLASTDCHGSEAIE